MSSPILDSPDLEVRRIMLKQQMGHALTPRESKRIASRMQVEDQTRSEGGTATQALPRASDPGAAYQSGRAGVRQLFQQPAQAVQKVNLAGAGGATGLTPTAPAAAQGNPVNTSPTTSGAQQTESADPLTGDNNKVPGGTTVPVAPPVAPKPGAKLSINGRNFQPTATPNAKPAISINGQSLPATEADQANYGGTGTYRQKFSNPTSAAIYDGYVKKLFSNQDEGSAPPQPQTAMTPVRRAPPTPGSNQPSDEDDADL